MVEHFLVSRDDAIYEAFPDLALAPSGKLVCVFAECTHHKNRDYTRIMLADSTDRGRTWSAKRPLTEALRGNPSVDAFWNCPRITCLPDGRLIAVVDRIKGRNEGVGGEQSNWYWISEDEGASWDGPQATPVTGIVPDQVIELQHGEHAGRWLLAAHTVKEEAAGTRLWLQRVWYSDDQGGSWHGPQVIAAEPGLLLCEGSIVELPEGQLVCFMRENSGQGLDAYKAVSLDGGVSWSAVCKFPLPACHRPVAGMLPSGKVMITYRHMQGGLGWTGWWTQNLFAAITDLTSCLATERKQAHTRILPVSFDRSPESDTGYSGWVVQDDGEIYIVNYLLDDAPAGQIRGYALRETDFLLPAAE